ncbi:MAG: HDOD domain-containing protein, partial [Phycisphaerales bacterium]
MLDVLPNPNTAARQVELALARLDSLSTLPCVGAQILSRLQQGQLTPAVIAEIIRADPALSAKCLSLVCRRGGNLTDGKFSLQRALDELPADDIRDAVLSVKAFRPLEPDYHDSRPAIALQRDLLLHSLAVACCARHIAQEVLPVMDSELAYYAGLLHDIGKLALREVMPKSFGRIVAEAESAAESSLSVERRNLGLDHTIVGRHLSQQWQLPDAIVLAAWLHHSDAVMISRDMPQARIAVVVQLADSMARLLNIGSSGSFDLPNALEPIAGELRISIENLEKIRENLATEVAEKSAALDLDSQDAVVNYCRAAHGAAARLSRERSELSTENRRLQSSASHL